MNYDFIIIGAGFYGCSVAIHLAESKPHASILIIDAESAALDRASKNNQARVHNGYHYPRSFRTGYRSAFHYPSFIKDYSSSIFDGFEHYYALASSGSKVSPKQFEHFCSQIGTPLSKIETSKQSIFERRRVSAVYLVDEKMFNVIILREHLANRISSLGIQTRFGETALSASENLEGQWNLITEHESNRNEYKSKFLINCTYSGIESIAGLQLDQSVRVKYENTEMALVDLPESLSNKGFTVMDGDFFSCVPYPSTSHHSLSHVKYTPHYSWSLPEMPSDLKKSNESFERSSNFDRMRRDSSRFIPDLAECRFVKSIRETKVVPKYSEVDDARPILFQVHGNSGKACSILGGKLDNIYDGLSKLDELMAK